MEIYEHSWKLADRACNGWIWLEMHLNDKKLKENTQITGEGDCWKWLEMAGNG